MDNNSVIIIGAGPSLSEGINKGLWEAIKGQRIWSVNFAFLTMPYLPTAELWVDYSFFKKNLIILQPLEKQKVELYAKYHKKYSYIKSINHYEVSRDKKDYQGKNGIINNKIYVGTQGLGGVFALSLAVARGYETIYLLGFDYGIPSNQLNLTHTHYYQNDINVDSYGIGHPEVYNNGIEDFKVYLNENLLICNVSLNSQIPYFPKLSFETFFGKLKNEKKD